MDAIEYFRDEIRRQARSYDVHRETTERSYGSSESNVDTVEASVTTLGSAPTVVTEGIDENVSMVAFVVPEYDNNGNLTHTIEVGDELRLSSNASKRYAVEGKVGYPNDIDPTLWLCPLTKANSS